MSHIDLTDSSERWEATGRETEVIQAEVVPEYQPPTPPARVRRRRFWLPLGLFLATCSTTLGAGCLSADWSRGMAHVLGEGLLYAGPLMTILVCHEGGHFLQARRYGVPASFPYFIPVPLPPLGTFGAVIGMDPRVGNRRAIFDIGITGPLAGLVPTLVFCIVGIHWSEVRPLAQVSGGIPLGEPLLFRFLTSQIVGPVAPGHDLFLHPMAFAGWVGLLITALNLLPVGQLDGGHVLYGLLREKADLVATLLLAGVAAAVLWGAVVHGYVGWTLMLVLLLLMGPIHPRTANDDVPLGIGRTILGWLTLAFFPIGFTPTPFLLN
jgi:membrane-associated protease RseP (regulator of RpoE activity)